MNLKHSLFLLQYVDSYPGCPPYLSGEFNFSEFEWEPLDPNAVNAVITKKYIFRSDMKYINFDYYGSLRIASKQFLRVCDETNVEYRAVPLEIILEGGNKSEKSYFLLLFKNHMDVLDRDKSVFEDAKDPRTGELIEDKLYPGSNSYDKIDSFVPKEIEFPPLFICIETGDVFCTEVFEIEAEKLALLGLSFTKIDTEYKYDPFADFS